MGNHARQPIQNASRLKTQGSILGHLRTSKIKLAMAFYGHRISATVDNKKRELKMRIYEADRNGKRGWIVDYTITAADGSKERKRPWFASELEARDYASGQSKEMRDIGEAFSHLEPWEKVLAAAGYLRAKQAGYSLQDACSLFETQRTSGFTTTVSTLVSECMKSKAEDSNSPEALRQAQNVADHFVESFGDKVADSITDLQIRDFLSTDSQGFERQWGPERRKRVLIMVRSFYAFGILHKLCKNNPALTVSFPKQKAEKLKKPLLSVTQAADVVKTCKDKFPALLPFLGATLFCGLRTCEAEKITWDSIHLDRRIIIVEDGIAKHTNKGRDRRIVPISDTAFAFLSSIPESERNGQLLKSRKMLLDFRGSTVVNGFHNILRHSFITYQLAASRNETETALHAGTSPEMIHANYNEVASKADAEKFFSITL